MTTTNYAKRYHYDSARGVYRGYGDAQPAHDRVAALMARGFTAVAIGRAAYVSHDTVTRVAAGTPRLLQTTARALENITEAQVIAATPGHGYVPRLGATRRVRALQRLGWTMPLIAQHAGVKIRTVHSVVDPAQGAQLVARATHDAIETAYRALCMTPGPDARNRRMGERRGWAPPLAWDDVDNPDEQPDYGTPGGRDMPVDQLAAEVARLTARGLSAAQIPLQPDVSERPAVRHRGRNVA